MKRMIVVVIDGLGVGSDTGEVNTLDAVLRVIPGESHGDTFESLRVLARGGRVGSWTECTTITPRYEGADSYKGHYEMIGLDVKKNQIFAHRAEQEICTIFEDPMEELAPGVYNFANRYYVSSNIEAALGTSINLIVNSAQCTWDDAVEKGKTLSKSLGCERVIVMGGTPPPSAIAQSILMRHCEELQDVVYGIIPARAGLYGEGYRVCHLGRGVDAYSEQNLLSRVIKDGKKVALVGKVCEIFQKNDRAVFNFPSVSISDTVQAITDALSTSASLLIVNFQSFDLCCHARNQEGAGTELISICDAIDELRNRLSPEDALILTADHGNDPSAPGHHHTVERVPFLMHMSHDPKIAVAVDRGLSCVAETTLTYLDVQQRYPALP